MNRLYIAGIVIAFFAFSLYVGTVLSGASDGLDNDGSALFLGLAIALYGWLQEENSKSNS